MRQVRCPPLPERSPPPLSCQAGAEAQRSAVRLLTRLGAASCYQKAYKDAEGAYALAQQLCGGLGDADRAAQLAGDLQRVLGLQQPDGSEAVAC